MTGALGTADAGPDAMATGNAMSMGLGTIDAFNQTGWGRQGWNVNAWGVEGQFANVDVTGIAMTAAAGTLGMTGNATLTLNTLNVAQATLGIVDPAPDAGVTGEANDCIRRNSFRSSWSRCKSFRNCNDSWFRNSYSCSWSRNCTNRFPIK